MARNSRALGDKSPAAGARANEGGDDAGFVRSLAADRLPGSSS